MQYVVRSLEDPCTLDRHDVQRFFDNTHLICGSRLITADHTEFVVARADIKTAFAQDGICLHVAQSFS